MAASLVGTNATAASIFLENGVAVLPGAVQKETTAACRDAAAAALAASDAAITNNIRDLDASAPGAHHQAVRLHRRDFAEYLKRDGGRVDLRFNSDAAPFDALLRETKGAVLDIATEALGGSAIMLYSGVMVARANAGGDHQRWHKDGNHENESDEPHALTVFVPLQPLTAANGPTEFRLGSHRRQADAKRLRQDGVAVECAAGDALLFDYRVDHRGLANQSDEDRLVFFCAFARPAFRDEKNARSTVALFPESHVAPSDRGETSCVLFELTVDGVGTIRVCEGDIPETVATAFCSKHDLPGEAAAPLAAAIEQQMELCKNV